jgi:hypothetical protein
LVCASTTDCVTCSNWGNRRKGHDEADTIEQTPPPETAAQSTEWAPAPIGPAVDVKLPETPMKNPVVNQTEGTGN